MSRTKIRSIHDPWEVTQDKPSPSEYRIFFVHVGVGTVLFKETNMVPRVGDRIALFTEYPFPVVDQVILWPEEHHLKELTSLIEGVSDIDALIFVKSF